MEMILNIILGIYITGYIVTIILYILYKQIHPNKEETIRDKFSKLFLLLCIYLVWPYIAISTIIKRRKIKKLKKQLEQRLSKLRSK